MNSAFRYCSYLFLWWFTFANANVAFDPPTEEVKSFGNPFISTIITGHIVDNRYVLLLGMLVWFGPLKCFISSFKIIPVWDDNRMAPNLLVLRRLFGNRLTFTLKLYLECIVLLTIIASPVGVRTATWTTTWPWREVISFSEYCSRIFRVFESWNRTRDRLESLTLANCFAIYKSKCM